MNSPQTRFIIHTAAKGLACAHRMGDTLCSPHGLHSILTAWVTLPRRYALDNRFCFEAAMEFHRALAWPKNTAGAVMPKVFDQPKNSLQVARAFRTPGPSWAAGSKARSQARAQPSGASLDETNPTMARTTPVLGRAQNTGSFAATLRSTRRTFRGGHWPLVEGMGTQPPATPPRSLWSSRGTAGADRRSPAQRRVVSGLQRLVPHRRWNQSGAADSA